MKKKNCLRKVLLLALTLCLLLGCAAAGAVAENAEQQKQGTKQIETNGGEINLLQTVCHYDEQICLPDGRREFL